MERTYQFAKAVVDYCTSNFKDVEVRNCAHCPLVMSGVKCTFTNLDLLLRLKSLHEENAARTKMMEHYEARQAAIRNAISRKIEHMESMPAEKSDEMNRLPKVPPIFIKHMLNDNLHASNPKCDSNESCNAKKSCDDAANRSTNLKGAKSVNTEKLEDGNPNSAIFICYRIHSDNKKEADESSESEHGKVEPSHKEPETAPEAEKQESPAEDPQRNSAVQKVIEEIANVIAQILEDNGEDADED